MKCKNCNKIITQNKTGLCRKCYDAYRKQNKVEEWLKTGNLKLKSGVNVRWSIRDYIYKDQQNKCSICGMKNIWQEKELKFILDHIDGNANNNNRKNLRLICPNCDSQLSTYKSKNKNSARTHRKKYN